MAPYGQPVNSSPEVELFRPKGVTEALMVGVEQAEESRCIMSLAVSIATMLMQAVDKREMEVPWNREDLGLFTWRAYRLLSKIFESTTRDSSHGYVTYEPLIPVSTKSYEIMEVQRFLWCCENMEVGHYCFCLESCVNYAQIISQFFPNLYLV